MRATPEPARLTVEELCKRLHDALKAAGILVDPPLIATISTRSGELVDVVAPPLFDLEQTELLCEIVEEGQQ